MSKTLTLHHGNAALLGLLAVFQELVEKPDLRIILIKVGCISARHSCLGSMSRKKGRNV